jgi:RHS repeat-associated protein
MTTDHLGSPRVITDKSGNVISRRDFMPFGEEIYAGVGGRNTNQKYANFGSDNIRKRYTGYEKDDETQLDFAEARMYQNKHGRFTAVDPLMGSASPGNPQTFNRYSYTGNNPINYTDPSGLDYYRDKDGNLVYFEGSAAHDGYTNITTAGQPVLIKNGGTFDDPAGGRVESGLTYIFGNSSFGLAGDAPQQAVEVKSVAEAITDTAQVIGEFSVGVMQGSNESAFIGLVPYSAPQSTDTLPQRVGQITGTVIIGIIGVGEATAGAGGSVVALVTGQVEAEAITVPTLIAGAVMTIGSAKNLVALSTTGMQENVSNGRPRKTEPVKDAEGPHTTIKKDPESGEITGTETFTPNPKNPRGFDSEKSVDLNPKGSPHKGIPTPHTQGKNIPGKVRPSEKWEIPK